ncbi:Cyclic nucleotide-binding domain-containing protein [Gammaproteobacteria bacterium]
MITEKAVLERLRSCVPLNSLTQENFQRLCSEVSVEDLPIGKKLFSIGDDDAFSIYLISGGLELLSNDATRSMLEGGKDNTRYAVANLKPRRYNGIARTPLRVVRMDSRFVDKLMVWESAARDNGSGFVVDELDTDNGDNTWVMRLLQKKMFLDLPAAHIQEVLNRMQEVVVNLGDVIVRQGDPGDYYYVICEGRCQVTREVVGSAQPLVLAELTVGDGFGEEALVSRNPRNATITMLTSGRLMRLSCKDFTELLEQPVLRWVSPKEAAQAAKEGAILLDVRTEQEYMNSKIRGSINIPLQQLREGAGRLRPNSRCICYCDSGERSSAAVFLLRERGYDASIMRGGLSHLMDLFRGKGVRAT